MAASPIGTNVVTAISRRYILPEVADNIYNSNPLFFRLNSSNRKVIQGGFQIELPLMWSSMTAGGPYQGYDLLDTQPADTVQNCAFEWKQYYVNVTVDGLTLLKTDSPEAIANLISLEFQQAEQQMADNLGTGLFSDGITNPKSLDGIIAAIDTTLVNPNYGGIAASTNSWWEANLDTATTVTSLAKYQALFGSCTAGGRHPTIILGTQSCYNYFYNLNATYQTFPSAPGGQDEQLAQAGFTNLLFNGVPFVVDSHISGTGSTGKVFMVNEDYCFLYVSPRSNFTMEDFQTPVNQDVMVAKLLWAGNLAFNNRARQGKFTALTS
jgi:hypothetical protein